VNLFSPLESDLAVRPQLSLSGQEILPAQSDQPGQREIWPWLAGLGLLALLGEWALYQSRRKLVSDWREWLPWQAKRTGRSA
jgi:hypothetical protein